MRGESRVRVGTLERTCIRLCAFVALAGLFTGPSRVYASVGLPTVPPPSEVPGCPVTAEDPDGDCDGDAPDDDDEPGTPPPKAVVCVPTVEEVEVCGRTETITEGCDDPLVTEAMHDEALKHDELKEEFQRMNTCVSSDPKCDALGDRVGDQTLNDEVDQYNKLPDDMPTKIRFHFNVTSVDLVRARDDMAMVVHKGFRRDPLSQHLLFRTHDDKKFNEDAEGVSLAEKEMADRERAELIKQAAVLEELRQKFEKDGDKDSEANTNQYKNIAVSRALALETISCELDRLAAINRRTENNMKPLVDLRPATGTDHVVPAGKSANGASDITGIVPPADVSSGPQADKILPPELNPLGAAAPPAKADPAAPSGQNVSGASRPPGASDGDGVTKSFGPDPNKLADAARNNLAAELGAPSPNDSLFVRIHRQYRVREAVGKFQTSLFD